MKPSSAALALAAVLGSTLVGASAHADPACIAAYEQTQTLRKDGKPVAAREQATLCAAPECPALLTKDCTRWLSELDEIIPSVVLDPRTPTGGLRADARVTIDGAARTARIDGHGLPLEPGRHVLVFEAHGAVPVERIVVLAEGEKGTKVTVTIGAASERRGGRIPLGVWIFGGASLAALAMSAVFAIDGLGRKSDLEECKPRCAPSDVGAMSSSFTVADVALGAGVAAGAAALYLFFTRPRAGAEATQPSSRSPIRPASFFASPLHGGASVGLSTRF